MGSNDASNVFQSGTVGEYFSKNDTLINLIVHDIIYIGWYSSNLYIHKLLHVFL